MNEVALVGVACAEVNDDTSGADWLHKPEVKRSFKVVYVAEISEALSARSYA